MLLNRGGEVRVWGNNFGGINSPPAGALEGIVRISADQAYALVQKSDGSLIAWGDNSYGQTTLPAAVSSAFSFEAAERHALAIVSEPIDLQAPVITLIGGNPL